MITPKILGARIRRHRKWHDMSQATLAEKADVSPKTLGDIETGKKPNPGWQTVGKIAETLGMTLSDVFKEVES